MQVFLVRDIYKDGDHSEQKIAQLTGFLAAAQSAARSMTALPWGMASDIVGRKVGFSSKPPSHFIRSCDSKSSSRALFYHKEFCYIPS